MRVGTGVARGVLLYWRVILMSSEPTSISELVQVLFKEGKRRALTLSVIFSTVAVLALVLGLMMPKKYDASALIIIEADAGFKPLGDSHGAGPSIADQTAVINQIVLGRKVMREVLVFGHWVKPPPAHVDPREEERLLDKLRGHLKIDNIKDEFVRVSFSDNDPKRTYEVANKVAEIYLRESDAGKERQSREAYDFVDRQVAQYSAELTDIQEKVLARYRADGGKTTAPQQHDAATPKPKPQKGKLSDDELTELRAEQAHLQAQVSRKTPAAVKATDARAEEQARARVVQLRGELDKLSATFTDEHPDVKRVKRELAAAQEDLDRAEQLVADREASSQVTAKLDDEMTSVARARLDEVSRKISAADGGSGRTPSSVTPSRGPEIPSIPRCAASDATRRCRRCCVATRRRATRTTRCSAVATTPR